MFLAQNFWLFFIPIALVLTETFTLAKDVNSAYSLSQCKYLALVLTVLNWVRAVSCRLSIAYFLFNKALVVALVGYE